MGATTKRHVEKRRAEKWRQGNGVPLKKGLINNNWFFLLRT